MEANETNVESIVKTIKDKVIEASVNEKTLKHTPALLFWKTVQEVLLYEKLSTTFKGESIINLRKEVLRHFLDDKRPLVRVIAQFESLPTVVFRRVLWHYNIDFKSKVSFLRRLTQEQISGIAETYENLFGDTQQMPACFTDDPKKRIRTLLYRTPKTLGDIFSAPFGTEKERYARKGAIAYDFFFGDMGFNVYPHENSDEKIPESMARQFLKRKTKQNDFSVNRESGIYWWLYSTPRGRAFGEKVEFKDAVCPGFWITINVWLLLLIISPLALLCGMKGLYSDWSLWSVIPFGLVGAITPVALVAVLLWNVYARSKPYIEKFFGIIDTDYWEMLGFGALIAVLGSILGAATYGVWLLMYYWNYESIALAIYFTSFIWFYSVYMLHKKAAKFPTSVPVLGIPTVLFAVGKTLFDYREYLWSFLLSIVAFISTFVVEIVVLVGIAGVLFLMLLWIIFYTTSTERLFSDEVFYRRTRLLWNAFVVVGIGFALITTGLMIYVYTSLALATLNVFTFTLCVTLVFCTIVFLISFALLNEPGKQRKRASVLVHARAMEPMSTSEEKFIKELSKNTWLQSRDDCAVITWKLVKLTEYFFDLKKFPREILTIDEAGYKQFDEYQQKLHYVFGGKKREKYVRYMCLGYTFEEAQKELDARKQYWRDKITPLVNLYSATLGRWVVTPLLQWVVFPLGRLIGFIFRILSDLWKMIRMLNEICPHTTRPTTIE